MPRAAGRLLRSGVGMSLREGFGCSGAERTPVRRWIVSISASLVVVGMTTLALGAIESRSQHDHLVFIYLLPAVLIAIRYGSLTAMGVTVASGLAAAYFLYAPRFSFLIARPLDLVELILFCVLALLAAQVVSGFAGDGALLRRR
jgi:K+-sensing histidine kinase KdpD